MNAQRLILAGVVILVGGVALAERFTERNLPPREAAGEQEGLTAFRQTFSEIVLSRNPDALLNLAATDLRGAAGGRSGVEAFRAAWNLDQSPGNSPLWDHLAELVEFEGAMRGDEYVLPYFIAEFPEELDPHEFGLITGSNVNVRARPELGAPVVRQVSHGVVRVIVDSLDAPPTETIGGETHPWVQVGLANGATGYVWGKYFRSPRDYQAAFQRVDGDWRMTYFGTGA